MDRFAVDGIVLTRNHRSVQESSLVIRFFFNAEREVWVDGVEVYNWKELTAVLLIMQKLSST